MRRFPQRLTWARAGLAAALALLAACSSPPRSATSGPSGFSTPGVEIAHVDHRYMTLDDFRRISEYFTGQENKSGRIIERTHPEQRAGYYFIVSLTWHPGMTLPAGTLADLDYLSGDDPAPHHAHFTFSDTIGTLPEILLGLTGADCPDKNLQVSAYKITFKDAAGKALASKQSFLWALPDDSTPAVAATTPAPAAAKP